MPRYAGIFPWRAGYAADVSLGTDPLTGKRRRQRVTGATKAEVHGARVTLLAAHQAGRQPASDQPLGAWLDEWLETIVAPRRASSTTASYRARLARSVPSGLARTPLNRLTPALIQRWISDLEARGLAPSTIGSIHAVLRAALAHAERLEIIARNPARLVSLPDRAPTPRRALTPDECRAFVAACADEWYGPLLATLLLTGLRLGEGLGVRWSDIDLEARRLTQTQHAIRDDDGYRLAPGAKSAASAGRVVPLPAALLPILAAWRARQRAYAASKHGWVEHGLAFPTRRGTPARHEHAGRAMRRILTRAKLAGLTPHDLRHAYASLLAARGVGQRAAMDLLGHRSLTMTTGLYTHTLEADRTRAADAVDRALSG